MVVDTVRARAAVRAAWVLNAHPVVYTLLHGDKDTYRLAFDFAAQSSSSSGGGGDVGGSGGGGDGGRAAEKAASVLRYQQVPYEPMALGALGPQAMADGSNAAPPLPQQRAGGGRGGGGEGVDVGAAAPAARPNNFCGQALLQRGPASGARLRPPRPGQVQPP